MSKGIGLIELNEPSDTSNFEPSYVLETEPYFRFFLFGLGWHLAARLYIPGAP